MMKRYAKTAKLVTLIAIIGMIAFSPLKEVVLNMNIPERFIEIRGYPLAPFFYAGFYIIGVLLALPGLPMTVMSGGLFGFGIGTLVAVLGSNIGTQLTFFISRYFGGDLSSFITRRYPYLSQLDKQLNHNGFRVLVSLRLLPIVPFNAINYLAGLTSISYRDYTFGNVLGMLPGTMLYVYFGAAAMDINNPAGIILSIVLLVAFTAIMTRFKKKSGLTELDESLFDSGIHTKILLIGGGHTHLELLRLAQEDRGFLRHVVLISNTPKMYYSGMISSWIEGFYSDEDISIDLEKLAARYGITFICSGVSQIDYSNKTVELENGETIHYDLVSINIGSKAASQEASGTGNQEFLLKPFSNLKAMKEQLASASAARVVVIGSGAAALETAMALSVSKEFSIESIVLLTRESGILPSGTDQVRTRFMNRLREMPKIKLVTESLIAITPGYVTTNHQELSADVIVWATGSKADSIFNASGMKTDSNGFMLVNHTLRSISNPYVFGSGDCIAIEDLNLAKNGVNAVREAPILYHNIRATLDGSALRVYQPKKPQLAIFSTGEQNAILQYGSVVLSGNWPWKLKHLIDSRYMRKHKTL